MEQPTVGYWMLMMMKGPGWRWRGFGLACAEVGLRLQLMLRYSYDQWVYDGGGDEHACGLAGGAVNHH